MSKGIDIWRFTALEQVCSMFSLVQSTVVTLVGRAGQKMRTKIALPWLRLEVENAKLALRVRTESTNKDISTPTREIPNKTSIRITWKSRCSDALVLNHLESLFFDWKVARKGCLLWQTPPPFPPKLQSAYVSGQEHPTCIFPSIIGRPKTDYTLDPEWWDLTNVFRLICFWTASKCFGSRLRIERV